MTVTMRVPSWPRRVLRVMLTIQTLVLFAQPVLIGGFLQGNYPWLALHQDNAILSAIVAAVTVCAAAAYWRWGRGSAWPVLASAGMVAAIAAQIALGFGRVLIVHVPLGVAIVAASIRLLVWAWQTSQAEAEDAAEVLGTAAPVPPTGQRTP